MTARFDEPHPTAGSATDRILDAALALFEEVGIRRTTLEDVAGRAGVDRVTIYRRVGSKSELVEAVNAREARRIFASVFDTADKEDAIADRIAVAFATVVHTLWNHPLINRLRRLEPATALPKMTTEASGLIQIAVAGTVDLLERSIRDRQLPPADDLAARAEVLVRMAHSFIVTPRGHLPLDDEPGLRAFAHRYLVPIVTADLCARPSSMG
ncbi:TetR/AcrR family transcriptional regulator [Amycolatopsis benzoatilytica]|uniref:TetR/AcrR family transcriptional regulator n=1 Tax=Amycolatopsis benzoatilytica TaxID=346045 RepID=UPI00037DD788|nr:TetR/AcrR family transcriptional regulator [Amycolatopsis benzoatilytica]